MCSRHSRTQAYQADLVTPCGAAGVWKQRETGYEVGSRELLIAVQGPCQKRGIRCTVVDGTGDVILFERM